MAEEQRLPEALEEFILVRLPVKSILRFESVCTRWLSMFRSKSFIEFYSRFSHEVSIPTWEDLFLSNPELRRRGRRSVLGPLSNGIYALTSDLHNLEFALFNPATRRIKFAPPLPNQYCSVLNGISEARSFELVCGFDLVEGDDYRFVVIIAYDHVLHSWIPRPSFLVFLYSSRTGAWETLVDYIPNKRIIGLKSATHVFTSRDGTNIIFMFGSMMACSQKLLNGCWHWMTQQYDSGDLLLAVLSFDFTRKSFRLIAGPPGETSCFGDVFVLQDHLAAIVVYAHLWLQIWTMRDLETWTNVYIVDLTTPTIDILYMGDWSFLHAIDYYQVKEPGLIRIKSLILYTDRNGRVAFNKDGLESYKLGEDSDEDFDPSTQINLSVEGILSFKPTLERLPLL